jgi:hypothetical protein
MQYSLCIPATTTVAASGTRPGQAGAREGITFALVHRVLTRDHLMNQFPAGCAGNVRIAVTAVIADVDDGRPGRAGPAEQILDRRPDRIRVRDRLGRLQHALLHIDEQQDRCHGPIVREGADKRPGQ